MKSQETPVDWICLEVVFFCGRSFTVFNVIVIVELDIYLSFSFFTSGFLVDWFDCSSVCLSVCL